MWRRAVAWFGVQIKHVLPPTIFFFFGFNLILFTRWMTLQEHGIPFTNFFAASILALVVGKVVLIVDNLRFMHRFDGAPLIQPNHAELSVRTGYDMVKRLHELQKIWISQGLPKLNIGVGVNTGPMTVGNVGSTMRFDYTVMGDAVNVASRLEGRTKFYGVGILVGEVTKNLVKDVVFKEVDKIKVKGKDEALTIYEPIGMEGEVDQKKLDELKLWQQTLRAYRSQQWDQVEMQLINLQRLTPDCYLYELYAERVAQWRREPPPTDWDGVTAFDEK